MQELIIYLLKSAALITLFYAGYYFLLKNDTSFKTNRIFLLAGIITSIFLPFLEITRTVMVETTATPIFLQDLSNIPVTGALEESAGIDWWQVAGIVYLLGLGFFLLKFLLELFLLLKLIFTHKIIKDGKFYIIQKCGNSQPFSFFKFIVFDSAQHTPTEQELILRHERCHARQWHSIDQLLTSLSVYLLWFNPLAWLYRKSVVHNLEYLADKEVLAAEVSKKEYQKTLLKISVGNIQPALTNQFYQSFIKKRIIMLNINATQKSNFWKTSFLLPFLLLFIFSFNIKTEAMEIPGQEESVTSKIEISAYVTKDLDEETLRSYERIFEKQGVDLKFDNLQYSDGLLTRVTASFRKESNGTSGNLTLTNTKGITPLLIYTDGNKVVMNPENAISKKPEGALVGIGTSPLFIIAGKEYKTSQLEDKYVEIIGEWSVLKPEEAKEQFGNKAKDGAIIISESNIIKDFKAALREIDLEQKVSHQTFIQVKKNETPILLSIKTEVNEKTTSSASGKFELKNVDYQDDPAEIIAVQRDETSTSGFTFQEEKPLIIVDGEVQDKDFNLDSIDPETIKSLNVLKGESTVEKYGKRAVNGVIEMNLKTDAEILQENEKKQDQKSVTKKLLLSKENLSTSYNLSKKSNIKDNEVSIFNVPNKDFSQFNALYVVDGKEMDKDFNPNSISPLNIESVMVLKGPKAIEKYGKKGSEGVIEIITKK
jgi:hypothetical protein